jgi:hypothetical protein
VQIPGAHKALASTANNLQLREIVTAFPVSTCRQAFGIQSKHVSHRI